MNLIRCFFLISLAAAGPIQAASTAYEALGVVRAKLSPASLQTITEVSGDRGDDQPQSWKILMNDSTARGGVREVVVSKGEIVSERTPLKGFSGSGGLPVIDLTKLNLDSNKAFKIANEAATKAKVGFHWLNYTLRTDIESGSPIWVVELVDYMGAPVGSLYVSAETGTVIRPLTLESGREKATQASPASSSDESGQKKIGGAIGEVEKVTKRTANTVKDGTLRVIGNVQEWLTGERTVGPPDDELSPGFTIFVSAGSSMLLLEVMSSAIRQSAIQDPKV